MPNGGGVQPDPADRADAAAKRRRVIAARRAGATWDQAARAGGYGDRGAAYQAVKEAFRQEREAMQHDLIELRQMEDERDDHLRRILHGILTAEHLLVSDGRIVKGPDGEPLHDSRPVLMAIDRLNVIGNRYALRHGINADKELKIALNARTDTEAQVVADTVFAVCAALGLPPDMRRTMLEAAQQHLAQVASDVPDQPVQ